MKRRMTIILALFPIPLVVGGGLHVARAAAGCEVRR